MIKSTIVLIIGLYVNVCSATAQSYKIESLEGNKANIHLYYKPSSGMLTISYLRDTIFINDYMSVDTVNVLNKVFLQINYAKRAGSNQDALNQLILYVSSGKLHQALHINSLKTYDMRPSEYSFFKIKVKLLGHDVNTYKLNLNIHNEMSSKLNPKTDYKYNTTGLLFFDRKNRVFYSKYEPIIGYYTFYNLTDKSKKYIKGDIPVVKIEKNKYYYVNGNWYIKYKTDFYSMLL